MGAGCERGWEGVCDRAAVHSAAVAVAVAQSAPLPMYPALHSAFVNRAYEYFPVLPPLFTLLFV